MTDEELLNIFSEEAEELIQSMASSLNLWPSDYSNLNCIKNIKRELHTLKGGARLVNETSIATKAHDLETFYESLLDKNSTNENDYQKASFEQSQLIELVDQFKKKLDDKKPPTSKEKENYLRIKSDLIDHLNGVAEELQINLSHVSQKNILVKKQLIGLENLFLKTQSNIKKILLKVSLEYKKLIKKQNKNKEDALDLEKYTEVYELTLSIEEIINDILNSWLHAKEQQQWLDTLITQQQQIGHKANDILMKVRTVSLDTLTARLSKLTQQVSDSIGKKVNFKAINLEGEIDRKIFDKILPALEHLIRNSIDHGIERSEHRVSCGKSNMGHVELSLEKKLNDFFLQLSDDGAGVNLKKVFEKAKKLGYISMETRHLSDEDILQFIFLPGFSTKEEISEVSGRGIGMDIVASQVNSIGGTINITTKAGEGTTFLLKIPRMLPVDRAIFFAVGEQIYGLQSTTVLGISRVGKSHLASYLGPNSAKFQYGDSTYKLRSMSKLLGIETKTNQDLIKHLPVLILKGVNTNMAVVVDTLLGSQEVTIKTLGAQFKALQEYAGATVKESGQVVMILNPSQLITKDQIKQSLQESDPSHEKHRAIQNLTRPPTPVVLKTKYVLIIDDSLTVRKVTTRLLEKHDFLVKTAKDGIEALEIIEKEQPHIIISDIEMPRMDGFELAERIKADPKLKTIPFIMITSRVGLKHKERAMQLGVGHFISKPYSDQELLTLIKQYMSKEVF